MNHQEYINELARQSAQKQASLNKKAAKNIVKGFAQGGPIGAIIEGVKAVKEKGKNLRNSAKEMDSAMLEQGKAANEELMNESDNQLAQNQQALQDVVNNSNIQGTMTGGASNVFNGNAQPNPIQDPISLYEESLRQQGFDDNVVNGIRQGLNSGHKEIDQWIQQYNNGAGRENPINIPQTEEQISLAREGQFNLPAKEGEANVKGTLFDKFINGISDLASGYQENSTTKFSPENLQRDKNKGVMNKIGEFAGTMSRVAKNPLVYGALAGGIASAMGNPFALGIGAKYAQEKAMSNVYRDVLSKYGINIPETVLGNVTNKDMDAIMLPELKKLYYNSMSDWRNQKLEDDKEYRAIKLLIDQMNADSNSIKAKAAMINANKDNGKDNEGQTVEEIISQNINKGGKKDDKKKKIYSF